MTSPGPRLSLLIVIVVAIAAQACGLNGPLLWDDVPLLAQTDLYTRPDRLAEALANPLGKATYYWRPLATTELMVESMLHGASPVGFRIGGALLHAAVAGLVLVLLRRITSCGWGALLGAAAFAVHPAHAETVTWTSARFDLMAALAGLGAFAAIGPVAAPDSLWRRLTIGGMTALALLSKESAFVLPALALLWAVAAQPAGPDGLRAALRARWRVGAAALGGLLLVVLMRHEMLGYVLRTREASVEAAGGGLSHLLLVGRTFAVHLGLIVFPFGLAGPAHYAAQPVANGDPVAWAGLALLGATIWAAVWALRARPRLGLLLCAFLVSLLPASQIVPLDLGGSLHAADRFVYLPSFFLIAAAVDAVSWYVTGAEARERAVVLAGRVFVLALAAWKVFVVLPPWSGTVAFWQRAHDQAPQSSLVLGNLVMALLEEGDAVAAEKAARELVELDPLGRHRILLVRALVQQEAWDEEKIVIEEGLEALPGDVDLHLHRGTVRLLAGWFEGALEDYDAAVATETDLGSERVGSRMAEALAGRASAHMALYDNPLWARSDLERAVELAQPSDQEAWFLIAGAAIRLADEGLSRRALTRLAGVGTIEALELFGLAHAEDASRELQNELRAFAIAAGATEARLHGARAAGHARAGRYLDAAAAYGRAMEIEPDTWDYPFYLLQLVRNEGVSGDRLDLARRLVRIRPESAQAYDALGYELYEVGQVEEAEAALLKAVQFEPRFAEARYHLGILLMKTDRADRGRGQLELALEDARNADQDQLVKWIENALTR